MHAYIYYYLACITKHGIVDDVDIRHRALDRREEALDCFRVVLASAISSIWLYNRKRLHI